MQSQDPQNLLVQIAKILSDLNIPYIITGGIAVLVWGRPRFTADIDIVIQLDRKNVLKLETALRNVSSSGYVDQAMIQDALQHQGEFNFIDGNTGIKVDFWILTDSLFDRTRLKRRRVKKILGKDIYFTSAEDLILIKLKWHEESKSMRQLEDIESIFKITKDVDRKYLERMAKKLNLSAILQKVVK